tara:strand:- start:19 stop:147 length:129 start_codon:yes stop_codon:yes gene_type:complete
MNIHTYTLKLVNLILIIKTNLCSDLKNFEVIFLKKVKIKQKN